MKTLSNFNVPQVTELVSGRAGTQTQEALLRSLCATHCASSHQGGEAARSPASITSITGWMDVGGTGEGRGSLSAQPHPSTWSTDHTVSSMFSPAPQAWTASRHTRACNQNDQPCRSSAENGKNPCAESDFVLAPQPAKVILGTALTHPTGSLPSTTSLKLYSIYSLGLVSN